MINWHDRFNELPIEVRIIGSAMENQTRIQQLKAEKKRLEKRYQQSCREIDDHIKRCEEWIGDLERDQRAGDQAQATVENAGSVPGVEGMAAKRTTSD